MSTLTAFPALAPPPGVASFLDYHGLAPREAEVLRYIAQGCTCLQTAHRMGLTTHTVNTYLRRIRAKFNVTTKADLTQLALALHLIGVPTAASARSFPGAFHDQPRSFDTEAALTRR